MSPGMVMDDAIMQEALARAAGLLCSPPFGHTPARQVTAGAPNVKSRTRSRLTGQTIVCIRRIV
jgi:hypothetical protein